jgi:tRNA (adenine57-N1/adenine58-N1)-methyltransferase catalytic subunit
MFKVRMRLSLAQENDRVLLVSPGNRRYLLLLRSGRRFHTNKGIIEHDALIGQPLGRSVTTHLGYTFLVLRPSLHDLLMNVKRVSQIIYPKDIGLILLKLDVVHGRRIIEAGTGSGALTLALAHAVRPDGMVYSYEVREEMLHTARRNLEEAGVEDSVILHQRDIAEGFLERDVDALFLDVREPWDYMEQTCQALADGGCFGALLPTTNQVSIQLAAMAHHPFMAIEVLELMLREYKPVPQRLRPDDHMIAHTGYLLFARKIAPSADPIQE